MEMVAAVEVKERTAEEWKAFISGHAGSGKTVAAYCRDAVVPVHRFFYWRTKLFATQAAQEKGSFIECRLNNVGTGGLVVECPGGYRIQIGRDCDPGLLEKTLKALPRC